MLIFHLPKQMKRAKEVWAQLLTAHRSPFVMPMLPAQLTQETRNVTFVFVTMALKAMALFAEV